MARNASHLCAGLAFVIAEPAFLEGAIAIVDRVEPRQARVAEGISPRGERKPATSYVNLELRDAPLAQVSSHGSEL